RPGDLLRLRPPAQQDRPPTRSGAGSRKGPSSGPRPGGRRRDMTRILGTALVWLAVASAARPGGDRFDDLQQQFDHDPKEALDARETLLYERDGAKVYDVTYASPQGGRVTAYLVTPTGKGPHAGLVFGHWGPGDRTEFLPEAKLYAAAGAVSLLIDYP